MNNNWFESRGLRVLDYQADAIAKVQDSLKQREITVLAACPSAGKTLMTTYMMEEYLHDNPNHKIMVLAHGTTILRTQFHDVLEKYKPDFSYNLVEKFNQYDVNAHANICLPQTLSGNILSKIDLLIVDEAHQFYFAKKMMKDILKQIKPKKQLLLTGTPSPFIRKSYNIIPVTLNTIFDEGMVSDLYVEIATSSYSFDPMYDFNQDNELKENVNIKESETKKTLDDLVSKIVDRLKSIKGNTYQNLLPEWLPTLKRLQKTMIACRSQHQAMQVKDYFDRIGVKSALSISDVDYDSKEIQVFKDEPDCLILIVVGRGILGFNYPELVNIVDMTTSQNVDRIYQLLCRVIRPHPEGNKKLFFKVAPNIHSDYYKYIMTAVLSLADENFFTKFNGKNFSDMIIPVIKAHTKKSITEPRDNTKKKSSKGKIKPVDFEGLPVFEFFKDLYHKKDALLHVYAYTTVRDVRAEFTKIKPNGYWTKEKCIESALNYKKLNDWRNAVESAYACAQKNGWLEDCTKHMIGGRRKPWTKEECIEDAKKYKNINVWQKKSSAYDVSKRIGCFNECTAHMIKLKENWTKEKCQESALNYRKKIDWIKYKAGAYSSARINGWLKECTAHMFKNNKWTKKECIQSALKYETIKEWYNNESGAIQYAKKNGIYDECIAHMKVLQRKPWTKKECIQSALKYETIKEWQECHKNTYQAARKNGWIEECTAHMKVLQRKPWTKEECIQSAIKYTYKGEWYDNESGAYSAARDNGWFSECCKHMINGKIIKSNIIWTKEKCIEDAKKYNRPVDWQKNNPSADHSARKHGWFAECIAHMKKNNVWTKENTLNDAKKYEKIVNWQKNNAGAYQAAKKNGWLEECTAHMQKRNKNC